VAAQLVEHPESRLQPDLVGLGHLAGERTPDLLRVRQRRLVLHDSEPVPHLGADRRHLAGQDRHRQREPLRQHAAQARGLHPEAARPEELRPRLTLGQKAVDLEEDAEVAGGELALLDDDVPAEDAGAHDAIRAVDRRDVGDALDRDEFALHGGTPCIGQKGKE
jgi:hypothetical protein